MSNRKLIVTHHSPDLDAITASWLLRKFDTEQFANAAHTFVNPGKKVTLEQAEEKGFQLHEVIHVDTGLGKFDHHQEERAIKKLSSALLVYQSLLDDHLVDKSDQALKVLVNLVTEIDHFQEVKWPDATNYRYCMMLHELIRGCQLSKLCDDLAQLNFGMKCLDYLYQTISVQIDAEQAIANKKQIFEIKAGKCLAIETRNSVTVKLGQKMGYILVVRKDPKQGHVSIKIRPDSDFNLNQVYQQIKEKDTKASWFYHNNGKMLINSTKKDHSQIPSNLKLDELISIIKDCFE